MIMSDDRRLAHADDRLHHDQPERARASPPRPPRIVLPDSPSDRSASRLSDGLSPLPAGSSSSISPYPSSRSPEAERTSRRPWEQESDGILATVSRVKEEDVNGRAEPQQGATELSATHNRDIRPPSPGSAAAGSSQPHITQRSSLPSLKTTGLPMPASGSIIVKNPSQRTIASTSTAKSRKSSCELCHHRKIKCDQGRPSCGSCHRKGHVCRYGDEAVENHANSQLAPRPVSRHPSSSGAVSPSNLDKLLSPAVSQSAQSSSSRINPEWSTSDRPQPARAESSSSRPNGNGAAESSGPMKSQRQRIVDGFDSDSDEEGGGRSRRRSQTGGSARGGADGHHVGQAGEEVDELASGDEEPRRSRSYSSSQPPKRATPGDDGLNGELLELASGPPKKKSRPAPAASTTSSSAVPRQIRHAATRPRASLPTYPSSSSIQQAPSARFDPYSTPLQALAANLPSIDTQSILFGTFFADPFLTEGISLLQPQFLEDFRRMQTRVPSRLREGDATTLTCAFAILSVTLRILPEETSRLILAQMASPPPYAASTSIGGNTRSLGRLLAPSYPSAADTTPLDQRYFDLAILSMQVADQSDMPSVMLVMAKLTLTRFILIKCPTSGPAQSGPMALAGGWLSHAIKMAHTLGMGKEWEGIPQGERELRRRVMWSLYILDRHWSFTTTNPYTILDAHQGIHLPSPISEADLYKLAGDATSLPSQSTETAPTPCTALFIHTHLARRITPVLDSFATVSPSNTPHDLVVRFHASLDTFEAMLPPYFRLFPMTDTHWDSSHPYVPAHRTRLHAALLSYRMGVHRPHLPTYLLPASPQAMRADLAAICISAIRIQRSARMLDPKVAPRVFDPAMIFEAAVILGLLLYVGKMLGGLVASPEMMSWRAGIAEAGELLDGIGGLGDMPHYARRAVIVLREIMFKVDRPLPSNDRDAVEVGDRGRTKTPEARGAHVTSWLERLLAQGMHMEMLLREPEWEKGWKLVAADM